LGADTDTLWRVRIVLDIWIVLHGAHPDRAAGGRRIVRSPGHLMFERIAFWSAIRAHPQHPVFADQVDADILAGEQPLAALGDFLEHGGRVGDRATDRGEDIARGPLLLQRLLRLVEQPYVLDR